MRERVQIFFNDPSLTRQEFKDECDLAKILQRFRASPEGLAALTNAQGFAASHVFADVSAVPDFRAAQDAIIKANASFMALPPLVRRRFDNDPASFLDFMQDPKNEAEARSLGLLNPKVETPPSV